MEKAEKQPNPNWSEELEDLVAAGDTDGAISLLEAAVSKLENLCLSSSSQSVDLQLASALTELANLYSSKHFSLRSDELLARASILKQQALHPPCDTDDVKRDLKENGGSKSNAASSHGGAVGDGSSTYGNFERSLKPLDDASFNGSSDDDWEAIADRSPNELLSSECLTGVSNISLDDANVQTSHRRGRGTFSYRKNGLYSDNVHEASSVDGVDDADVEQNKQQSVEPKHSKYGTHHVLILADFPPSTRTIDLEKHFEDFRDHGVVIRWVNDTVALAVFRAPPVALEARNQVKFPFTMRILEVDDILMDSISMKDLEPPRQRPRTSARTAQRLIAQGMGLKLPSTAFGSRELKTQEEARRNRIVTRQKMKDDAWGDD
ncbi:hypothetical protein K2173_014101 [Erythroxylum novogranatense]|uniref:Coiled-coil domain-containing protein R3HCC1L n=1 Tax=Erythroxylum novogranatense TaxID=1862640 RepID=A0AAV8SDA1_9ROSI|nr:hypothetical protein K2173_014101 [Erythroxylum novogranatense]